MAYGSNESLVLLNKNLKRLGTISPYSDKNMFWGESFNRQIADDSSSNDSITGLDTYNRTDPNANSKMWGDEITGLTMTQDSPMAVNLVVGNSIARYNDDIGKWEVYRIINTDETIEETTGRHLVIVEATNLAIWHLGKTIPPKKEIKECTLAQAMAWLLAGSGWDLQNNSESGLLVDMQFDGTSTSQSYLQNVLTYYDCEAQAYITFDSTGFIVDDLILELSDHIGSEEPVAAIRYGKNLRGIHRKTVDTTLISKLYVYGPDGQTVESVNGGKDFILDPQANTLYNNDPDTWLEGAITSQSIKQPAGLLAWGQKQLQLYNHPRVNYEVSVSTDFNPKLGDTVKVIDSVMSPALTIQARVIQKQESLSNPYGNTVTLGEFATVKVVTPNFIKALQEQYSNQVKALFEKAKKDSTASSVSLITPYGTSWYNTSQTKKAIARLFIEGQNVTSYLTRKSFNWQYIQLDGSHNTSWEADHKNDSYQVEITPPFKGTLLCSINDDYVSDQPEVWVNGDSDITNISTSLSEPSDSNGKNDHVNGDFWVRKDVNNNILGTWRFDGAKWVPCNVGEIYDKNLNADGSFRRLWRSHYNQNYWKEDMWGGLQCLNYMQDGNLIGSHAYSGVRSTKKLYGNDVPDTEFIRFNGNGDLMDVMIVHGGGHGSSFTYNQNDQLIYTLCKDYNSNKWYVGAMPYRPNQEVWVNSFTWRCEVPRFMRPVFQFNAAGGHSYMLASMLDGGYVLCDLNDLIAGNYKPLVQGKLQDFGIQPSDKNGSNGITNTMQSNGLNYPFAFFSMGDANNKDVKQILAINVLTQSQEFKYVIDPQQNIKVDIPISEGGVIEPEGLYYDSNMQSLLTLFNQSEWTDGSHTLQKPVSALYSIPLKYRQDAFDDAIEYPTDDGDITPISDAISNPSDDDDDNQQDNVGFVSSNE